VPDRKDAYHYTALLTDEQSERLHWYVESLKAEAKGIINLVEKHLLA